MFSHYDVVMNAALHDFGQKTVLVVGDLMLDRYIWGEVGRISPEAPVPVLRRTKETDVPGGAANVALNLRGLGLKVQLAGLVGQDAEGKRLVSLLKQEEIDTGAILKVERPTTTKLRVVSKQQQMLRIDHEDSSPCDAEIEQRLVQAVSELLPQADALILSDYAKGVLTTSLCQRLIAAAKAQACPVYVDPKGTGYDKYRGATTVTPNTTELCAVTGADAQDAKALLAAARGLRERLDLEYLLLTRSEKGISLIEPQATNHYLAAAQDVFDVSGAGDTVVATFVAACLGELDRADAVRLANLAAGVVIGRLGTSPIDKADLLQALRQLQPFEPSDKICDLDRLKRRVATWQSRGEKVVFTNGCFDLLHVGHITYLEKSKALGDRLVVGLNTDRSVRTLKGPERPVINEADRARVLAGLGAIDAVILFDDDTPLELICALRPDTLVKGSDYNEEDVVGAKEVKTWGGDVKLISVVEGRSTSHILERIKTVTP